MLVPFAIDAESLNPDQDWTTAQYLTNHKAVLEVGSRFGILVHDGEHYENSKLKAAIDNLPQKVRALWQDLIENEKLLLLSAPKWSGIIENDPACFQEIMSAGYSENRLLLLDDVKAEVEFNLEEDELCRLLESSSKLEVCRFQSAKDARFFKAVEKLETSHLENEDYEEIWKARFSCLAQAPIKRISIVDRYAIINHFESPQSQLSGLERFLRLLDKDAGGKRYVSLYSAKIKEGVDEIKNDCREILRRLPKKNIKEIKITLLSDSDFGKIAHDRHIRFQNYVWTTGKGLEVFEVKSKHRTKLIEISFKMDVNGTYRKVEETIEKDDKVVILKVS